MKRICIFFCSGNTYPECIEKNLFGSNKIWPMEVHLGDICCLYHYDIKILFGLWRAESDGARGIVPSAWGGKFPYQVKVKLISTEIIEIPPMITGEFMDSSKNDFEGVIEFVKMPTVEQFFSNFYQRYLMSGKKHLSADDVPLIPMGDFKLAAKKVLSVSKKESDKQLAKFQASNLKKREAKKRR